MLAVEFSFGINPLLERRYGSVGMEESFGIDPHRTGTHRVPIEHLQPGSELALMGAQLGDQLSFDHHVDRWRKRSLDGRAGPEHVRVTLWHEGQARPLTLTAAPQSFSAVEIFDYLNRFFLGRPSVAFRFADWPQAAGPHSLPSQRMRSSRSKARAMPHDDRTWPGPQAIAPPGALSR